MPLPTQDNHHHHHHRQNNLFFLAIAFLRRFCQIYHSVISSLGLAIIVFIEQGRQPIQDNATQRMSIPLPQKDSATLIDPDKKRNAIAYNYSR
jgi:hypothetical protein